MVINCKPIFGLARTWGFSLPIILCCYFNCTTLKAHDLKGLVREIKPGIVGIGTQERTRRPPNVLMATGFVVGNGHQIVTNAHAIPTLDESGFEKLVIFVGTGRKVETRPVKVVKTDTAHDLVLLRQDGPPLHKLDLAPAFPLTEEGSAIAFIGYPIGSVLGLYPVTHSGILAAVTPVAIPAAHSNSLSATRVRALKDPYFVFQLDATAYPGNSGSPVIDTATNNVIAVINKVFIKSKKENVLSEPSGITYAIPVRYVHNLLK